MRPLAQALADRRQAHAPVLIVGENTRLRTNTFHTLSTRPLNHVLEIDKTNYTATAEAGVTLKELFEALQQSSVFCALPHGHGTLGGAFASGCMPDFYPHVLGVEALLPDGSYVRYGGKLMKNAAGYHLTRLFAGSQGTLGLVTQLTFKIFAHPIRPVHVYPFVPGRVNPLWRALKTRLDPEDLFPALPGEPYV